MYWVAARRLVPRNEIVLVIAVCPRRTIAIQQMDLLTKNRALKDAFDRSAYERYGKSTNAYIPVVFSSAFTT